MPSPVPQAMASIRLFKASKSSALVHYAPREAPQWHSGEEEPKKGERYGPLAVSARQLELPCISSFKYGVNVMVASLVADRGLSTRYRMLVKGLFKGQFAMIVVKRECRVCDFIVPVIWQWILDVVLLCEAGRGLATVSVSNSKLSENLRH